MTTDRTEELIRTMLERRTSVPPRSLAPETMRAVGMARQRRSGRLQDGPAGRVAVVAATAVLLVATVGGVAIGSRLVGNRVQPPPQASILGSAPSASPVSPDATPTDATSGSPAVSDGPGPSPTPSGGRLAADSIAVVTTAGDQLRVRTRPGTGADSERLQPLLGTRTRLLVLDGPVQADGFDWYQVFAPQPGLAGWVAKGNADASWLRVARTRCPERLDAEALYVASSIDLLLCYREGPVEVAVDSVSAYEGAPCDLDTERDGCDWAPSWFGRRGSLGLGGESGAGGDTGAIYTLDVVLGQGVTEDDLEAAHGGATVTLRFDHPDAEDCSVRDGSGAPTMEPWQAVLACRLMPVVESVRPENGA
jgi:hypothetical protein